MTIRPLALLALALAAPSHAIELSLEENRAERGNIGYIDMGKLFRQFPETVRSRENFDEILRQTEDQINLRKVEILKARNELSQMRMEREMMAKAIPAQLKEPRPVEAPKTPALKPDLPKVEPPKPEPAKPESPKPESPKAAQTPAQADLAALKASEQAAKAGASGAQDISQLPGFGSATPKPEDKKPEAPKPDSLIINIPGVSTAPVVVQPPEPDRPSAVIPAVAASTQAAVPTPTPKPAEVAGPNPELVELDAKIALRTHELEVKEAEFKRYQAEQEKNLLDLESRKTEVLLGKIHRAVQEVARREGVSVVVDKNSILYGHDAVDLTEKVLKFLKGV